MPDVTPPVQGAPPLEFQDHDGWDPTMSGEQDPAQQSNPGHAYDATPGSGWSWLRWKKTIDGGQADMSSGEPTGSGWMPDGASDASRWKGV
jgi:hypothetical protein